MRAEHQGRQRNWHHVGDDVLHGVRVLRRKGHGGRELVVNLVNARIQGADVQQPVGVVEEHFAGEHAYGEVSRELHEGRYPRRDLHRWRVAGRPGYQGEEDMEAEDDALVPERDGDRMPDIRAGGLLRRRLDLVLCSERRAEVIERDKDGRRNPPEDDLDQLTSNKVDGMRVVVLHDPAPEAKHDELRYARISGCRLAKDAQLRQTASRSQACAPLDIVLSRRESFFVSAFFPAQSHDHVVAEARHVRANGCGVLASLLVTPGARRRRWFPRIP